MAAEPRPKFRAKAIRVGAKSDVDFLLFEHLHEQRKAMKASADTDATDDVAHNMFRIYDLVLTHGRFFQPSPRPNKYKAGDRNQCYGNSLDLVVAHDDLSYCEGYVVVEGMNIPMEHGWCVTDDGSLVDVTLRKPIVPLAYFGVVFNSLFAATRDLPAIESILIEDAKPDVWRA